MRLVTCLDHSDSASAKPIRCFSTALKTVLRVALLALPIVLATTSTRVAEATSAVTPTPTSDDSSSELDGLAIAHLMASRPEAEYLSQSVEIVMRSQRGRERRRSARIYRWLDGPDRRTALFYEQPSDVRGTGFLTFDYGESGKADDQWLYLPSTRKVRRVSASERGDSFLGTDLTYEEIKKDGRFEVAESSWNRLPDETLESGVDCWVVEATLATPALVKQLGHAGARIWVDKTSHFPRRIEYYGADAINDSQARPIRTLTVPDLEKRSGLWVALTIEAFTHKRGNSSLLSFADVDTTSPLDERIFTQQQLQRGLP